MRSTKPTPCLLLISPYSLASHEVTHEIALAHGLHTRLLPLYCGVTRDEMQQRQPSWRFALAGKADVTLDKAGISTTVARMQLSLAEWEIQPTGPTKSSTPKSPRPRRIWASDANQIDIGDLDKIVYRNQVIENFLSSDNKFFLSANKGLGKTLLLTYKRSLLASSYRDSEKKSNKVFFVPEGRPYLDFMADLRSIGNTCDVFLADLKNAKRLWAFALRVSAISHHGEVVEASDADELSRLPDRISGWLRGEKTEATVVFKELLNCSLSLLNRIVDESENFLEHKFRRVHSGTFIFIDKVDQSLRHLSKQAWIAVQAGLIEAAWDAMNANNHVKIYASIRQEAFANYESDIKTNLFGATTVISYTNGELRKLLDQLACCYEGGRTFKEFAGVGAVRTPNHAFPEDSFDYACRHTLGRPRDLVIIASEISNRQDTLTEPAFRKTVDETSARILVSNVFEEMRVFLDCLGDRQRRLEFLSLLPHNVLAREEVIDVWHRFNGVDADQSGPFERGSPGMDHPFWELYCTGLLGCIEPAADGLGMVQRFKQPADLLDDSQDGLPDVSFYLVHPALEAYIRNRWAAGGFNVFCHLTVGHGCRWDTFHPALYQTEKCLFSINDVAVRRLAHVVLKETMTIFSKRFTHDIEASMEEPASWQDLRGRLLSLGLEDAVLWFEELINYQRDR